MFVFCHQYRERFGNLIERMSLTARSELWICQLCLTHAPFLRVDLCIYFEFYKSKRSLHVTFRKKTIDLYTNKRGVIFFIQSLSAAEGTYKNWNLQRFFRLIYDYLDWGKKNSKFTKPCDQNIYNCILCITSDWPKTTFPFINFSVP